MTDPSTAAASSMWRRRILLVLVAAVVIPVGASIVYTYPPTDPQNSFYPGCVFNKVTGLHCPGCGATRCVYALLHGDVEQAFAWNPLFVLLLPLLLYGLARLAYEAWMGQRAKRFRLPDRGVKLLFALLIAYWIVRNIPVYPLTLLAPHALEGRAPPREGEAPAEPEKQATQIQPIVGQS